MNFTFLEVTNCDMLEKVFEFRYKILLEIYPEYIEKSFLKDNKDSDKYDLYSIHFAALDEDGEVCATVRLIYNSPIGYPTENGMIFDKDMFDRDKLGEMSRIFIDTKYRNMKNTKIIIEQLKKMSYFKMIDLGIAYSYGSLETNFLRLLRIYKMCYTTVGKGQEHGYFGLRYPCILYTKQLGTDNPELIELWKKHNEV